MEGNRTLRAGRFAYPEVPPVPVPAPVKPIRPKFLCDCCSDAWAKFRCDCCGTRYCERCAGPKDECGASCPDPGCNYYEGPSR